MLPQNRNIEVDCGLKCVVSTAKTWTACQLPAQPTLWQLGRRSLESCPEYWRRQTCQWLNAKDSQPCFSLRQNRFLMIFTCAACAWGPHHCCQTRADCKDWDAHDLILQIANGREIFRQLWFWRMRSRVLRPLRPPTRALRPEELVADGFAWSNLAIFRGCFCIWNSAFVQNTFICLCLHHFFPKASSMLGFLFRWLTASGASCFERWCADGVGARERKGKEGNRRDRKGKEGNGRVRKGKEGKGRERKGKKGKGRERERKGQEGKGRERKGKDGKGRERKGKGRERKGTEGTGRERKGKEGKGRERKGKKGKEREKGKGRERKGTEGTGRERKGKEGKGRERKGKKGKGRERKGTEGTWRERTGKEGKGRERKGKKGKGRERKGKKGEGRERTACLAIAHRDSMLPCRAEKNEICSECVHNVHLLKRCWLEAKGK